ncbi:MAG: helix-turn-helix transcriptional regulator [Rhodoblastus sp.]|nr:MAG: helix-turn-helix transcriptional regulator [Rhodoblastus sp.]
MIKTPAGEELVILPRAEYDALVAAAADADEDAADAALFDARMADLAAGRDAALPPEVSAHILKGASLLTALRKARGMTQTELAERAGLGQGYLSDLETGRRKGAADTLAALATALECPAQWLTP